MRFDYGVIIIICYDVVVVVVVAVVMMGVDTSIPLPDSPFLPSPPSSSCFSTSPSTALLLSSIMPGVIPP